MESRKSFGSVEALREVDFEVRAGEVMALVGDNGAGKSTLIKCVAGIYSIDDGEILFDGKPVLDPRPEGRRQARDRGRLPGSRALRQPRRRPEHVPRPRGRTTPSSGCARRRWSSGRPRRWSRCRSRRSARCASRSRPLGRPAPVGRGRARRAVEQPRRLPRRADGGARRRADAAGAGSRQAPRRAGARRCDRLAQPGRRVRGGEQDHRPAARPQRRRLRAGRRRTSRRSCRRSPRGRRRRPAAS